VVGAVAGFVFLLAALLLLLRRRRNNAQPAAAGRQEMGERSESDDSGIEKPAPVVYGSRSSTAKPGPVSSEISMDS
jgi:LPXTG-motif cell wall-anchored protein